MDFVQRLMPKQIFPIVQETDTQGMMKDRIDYLRDRVDLSPLLPFLSREPMFKIEIPEFLHPPPLSNHVPGMPRYSKVRESIVLFQMTFSLFRVYKNDHLISGNV